MQLHTKTPWYVNGYMIDGADDKRVADCDSGRPDPRVNAANAAYIVKCVNSHEALLEACKVAVKFWSMGSIPERNKALVQICEALNRLDEKCD